MSISRNQVLLIVDDNEFTLQEVLERPNMHYGVIVGLANLINEPLLLFTKAKEIVFDNIIESNNNIPELILPEIAIGLEFEHKAADTKVRVIGLAINHEQAYCKISYNIICDVPASVSYKWMYYKEIHKGFEFGEYTLIE